MTDGSEREGELGRCLFQRAVEADQGGTRTVSNGRHCGESNPNNDMSENYGRRIGTEKEMSRSRICQEDNR